MFMNKRVDLIGVVLCGGQSRRMGRDKGLIERDGMSWAARMGRKLLPWGLPVVYSIRAGQEDSYSGMLPEACFVTDAMDWPGPLNGLYSVHRQFPASDLLLLACDMQDTDEETIGELMVIYRAEDGADCYVYQDEDFVQPFCGIYRARGLKNVFADVGEDWSLQAMIRRMKARRLGISKGNAFRNYNSNQ
jgi:molybdenum cofactor guanylyltransferase